MAHFVIVNGNPNRIEKKVGFVIVFETLNKIYILKIINLHIFKIDII